MKNKLYKKNQPENDCCGIPNGDGLTCCEYRDSRGYCHEECFSDDYPDCDGFGECICKGDDYDCANVCHGTSVKDVCGICEGDNTSCTDDCGVLNGDIIFSRNVYGACDCPTNVDLCTAADGTFPTICQYDCMMECLPFEEGCYFSCFGKDSYCESNEPT